MTQLTASAALHAMLMAVAAFLTITPAPALEDRRADRAEPLADVEVGRLVFIAPALPGTGGGGGGGGNRQSGPIRPAQGVGSDQVTLRVRTAAPPPPAPPVPAARPVPAAPAPLTADSPALEDVPALPSLVLETKPLASGLFDQIGLPTGGVSSSASTGPGDGGGVGSGSGTGIGSGHGPGLGPGSGGGTGGGVYRPGGAVSAPRLIKNVAPKYTGEAMLRRIEGTVVLEAVVKTDGCASRIQVVRSLDRGGLDDEAVAAVAQWRFEPGRLAGAPVDVLVTIMLDFTIR